VNKAEIEEFKEREMKRQKMNEDADGGKNEEEAPTPIVPLSACLDSFADVEHTDDYYSPAAQAKVTVARTTRFSTFPKYLWLQLGRYYVGEDWRPKKLLVNMDIPERLSLEGLRGKGLQEGETEMPEEQTGNTAAPEVILPDESIVASLMSMGFSENGSKRAAVATSNASSEVAMEWVFAHMEDPDFNNPLPSPEEQKSQGGASSGFQPNEEAIMMLSSMGFSREQVEVALKCTDNNADRAAEWLFSHADNLDEAVAEASGSSDSGGDQNGTSKLDDGPGEYELVGFVSHTGKSTDCGHYVAHIKKNSQWVIFNDRKVAISKDPPLGLGYMYLYRRLS